MDKNILCVKIFLRNLVIEFYQFKNKMCFPFIILFNYTFFHFTAHHLEV